MKRRIIEEIEDEPAAPIPAITEEMIERSRQPGNAIDRSAPDERAKNSQTPVFF